MFRLRKLGTQKLFLEPPKNFWPNKNFSPQENVRVWPWSAIACFHFLFFSWKGMLIRSTLAALDFNFNVNRKDKLSSSGQPLFKIKVGNWLLVLYFLRLHCVYGHSCFFTRTHNYSQEEKLFLWKWRHFPSIHVAGYPPPPPPKFCAVELTILIGFCKNT